MKELFYLERPNYFLLILYICDRILLLNNGQEISSQNYHLMRQLFSGTC